MKKLFTLIALLATIVSGAWAETRTVLDLTFTGLAADAGVTTDATATINNANKVTAPSNCVGIYLQDSWKCYKTTTGLRNVSKGDRTVVIPNLKTGDVVVIKCNNTDYLNSFSVEGTANSAKTEYTATMTADGYYSFKMIKAQGKFDGVTVWPSLLGITVTREVIAGTCEDPTGSATGAKGNARTMTLSCETDGSTIYYSETKLATAEGGTEYTTPFSTEATKIWAYAKTATSTSNVVEINTGAGSTLTLNSASVNCSAFTNKGSTITGVQFTIKAPDNSSITGKPASTLTYTFTPDGGSESSPVAIADGGTYAPTTKGTLKVYAAATGYDTSTYSISVSNVYAPTFTGRDYTTATTDDFGGDNWNAPASVTWDGWASGLTSHLLNAALNDDKHLNIQNGSTINLIDGWGLTRSDKTYGYRSRYAVKGDFFALKVNTSKGSDANATAYRTVYCTSGNGVITDLVTITASTADLVQQLIQYSPVDIITLTSSEQLKGYKTFYNATKNYKVDANTTIYTATAADASSVTILPVEGETVIPAGTPVMVKTTASDYKMTLTATNEDATGSFSGNLFQAAAGGETNKYILAYTTADGLAFYMFSPALVAGDVYLDIASGAKKMTINFDDVTAVAGVSEAKANVVKPVKLMTKDGLLIKTANGIINAAAAQVK